MQPKLRKTPRSLNRQNLKTKDMATIFSRIIAGEIPSYKVAENEDYYAFLDINPLTKGHTLVVPKKEVDYIFDLDDRTLAGMMLFAKEVAAKIKRGNSVCKGSSRRFRPRSAPCTHSSDPHSERKRRGFPPRKAQTDAGRVLRNSRQTLEIEGCLQIYNKLYLSRIVGYQHYPVSFYLT